MADLKKIRTYIENSQQQAVELAQKIWEYAEISYEEVKSSAAMIALLKKEGFTVEEGIAEIPTAFKASYQVGTGKPVMGLLAEYDALDGLSQKAGIPVQDPIVAGGCGHGCGHNLLGAGCYLSAVALKNYLLSEKLNGTIVLFGCPAEEGAGSKQFIARAGYFDDVDFVYCWHPGTVNEVQSKGSVAIMGANFIFDGVASHAGGAPHLGRSALDTAELMNVGCNYLREHMIDQARIHYAYSDAGGTAPNVVQSHAVIKYEVRAPKINQMQELFTRVVDVARGAAMMVGTQMKYEVTMAFSDYLPNKTLAKVMDEALQEAGAPQWSEEDYDLALQFLRTYSKAIQASIRDDQMEKNNYNDAVVDEIMHKPLDSEVHSFDPGIASYESGSTDVGDVGYATPTVCLNIATACVGNIGHTWQNTAFSASPIGYKGMVKAAEVMTLAFVKTLEKPELIEAARKELLLKNGGHYTCPLHDYVKPPIGKY